MIRRQRVRPGWGSPSPWWYPIAEFLTLAGMLALIVLVGALCSVKG